MLHLQGFSAIKTGPGVVLAGQAFDFTVTVFFFGKPDGNVTVSDPLPAGLSQGNTAGTWLPYYADGSTGSGGCELKGTCRLWQCHACCGPQKFQTATQPVLLGKQE